MKKRGLANQVQIVLIIILAVVLAGIVALFVNQSIISAGERIDAEVLVLQSEFSVTSVRNNVGSSGLIEIAVRRDAGTGTYPTVILYGELEDGTRVEKVASYEAGDITIFQTVTVTYDIGQLMDYEGWKFYDRIEVYATTKDASGQIVNSRNPKDILVITGELVAPPEPVCGDGFLSDGEMCDDSNTVDGDGCSADCMNVENGWECLEPGQPCQAICGDSIIISGEEACDDGNALDCNLYGLPDGCSADCQTPQYCGNGVTEPGIGCDEECDDGADGDDTDQCTDGCTLTYCGDDIIQDPSGEGINEICDGNAPIAETCESILGEGYTGTVGCGSDCQSWDTSGCSGPPTPECGDGSLDPGEVCDDGNKLNCNPYPGCSADCLIEVYCGNGVTESGIGCDEECDDGADGDDSDQCTDSCIRTFCGDSVVQSPNGYGVNEECDDGADGDDSDQCTDSCTLTYCGDDVIQDPNGEGINEICDDGADNSNQPGHCRPSCILPFCGDGICDPGEGSSPSPSPPLTGHIIENENVIGASDSQEWIIHAYKYDSSTDTYYNGGSPVNCPQDCGGSPDMIDEWYWVDNENADYSENTLDQDQQGGGLVDGQIAQHRQGGGGITN